MSVYQHDHMFYEAFVVNFYSSLKETNGTTMYFSVLPLTLFRMWDKLIHLCGSTALFHLWFTHIRLCDCSFSFPNFLLIIVLIVDMLNPSVNCYDKLLSLLEKTTAHNKNSQFNNTSQYTRTNEMFFFFYY